MRRRRRRQKKKTEEDRRRTQGRESPHRAKAPRMETAPPVEGRWKTPRRETRRGDTNATHRWHLRRRRDDGGEDNSTYQSKVRHLDRRGKCEVMACSRLEHADRCAGSPRGNSVCGACVPGGRWFGRRGPRAAVDFFCVQDLSTRRALHFWPDLIRIIFVVDTRF